MEAMLSVVAPTLFPALEKSLQVAFVTGYAASLQSTSNQTSTRSPTLPSRDRPRRLSSKVWPGRTPYCFCSCHNKLSWNGCLAVAYTRFSMKMSSPATQDEEARPKAPPNDPQRQGNIWHRYEQLESMTKSLAGVNQQMVLEKTKHQRVCACPMSSC